MFTGFGRKQEKTETARVVASPASSAPSNKLCFRLMPAPKQEAVVETITAEDLPSFLKTDEQGTPANDLPHQMSFRPPPRR